MASSQPSGAYLQGIEVMATSCRCGTSLTPPTFTIGWVTKLAGQDAIMLVDRLHEHEKLPAARWLRWSPTTSSSTAPRSSSAGWPPHPRLVGLHGPRYSPHGNPVEWIWAALKAWLANSPALTIQGRIRQVHGYFRACMRRATVQVVVARPGYVREHQISIWCSQRQSLSCSVNDAVNALPCSTCAYLNALPFQDDARFPAAARLRIWRLGFEYLAAHNALVNRPAASAALPEPMAGSCVLEGLSGAHLCSSRCPA